MKSEKENPFIVGKVAVGDHFADRKDLLKEILLDSINGQNMTIVGPRRVGKTSLVKELLRQAKETHKLQTIYIDLLRYDKIETIAGQIFKELTGNVDKAVKLARSVIKGIAVKLNDTLLELSLSSSDDLLIQVLDYLEKKTEKNKRIVVAFDEFQELELIDPKKIKLLRSIIQNHKMITYLFTGSKQRIVEFFISSKQPFYKFGKVITIGKPHYKEMSNFLEENFEKSSLKLSKDICDNIVDESNNLPYFTQILAHDIWLKMKLEETKEITKNEVGEIVLRIIDRNTLEYEQIWSSLSKNQRKALKILSKTKNPYKNEVLTENKIAQASLQTAIKSLIENQYLWEQQEKIEFLDPFLEKWIKNTYI